jgi:hypothetical protein
MGAGRLGRKNMIRKALIMMVAGIAGCAEAPPVRHADGETIAHAVQQAQAQADKASGRYRAESDK